MFGIKDKYVLDTNVLLSHPYAIDEYEEILLNSTILEELDNIKKGNDELSWKARRALKKLENATNITFISKEKYKIPFDWDANKKDNQIIALASEYGATIVSNDLNVRLKANSLNLKYLKYENKKERKYIGYTEVTLTHQEQSDFYENLENNNYNLLENEYLIINDIITKQPIDKLKYTKEGYKNLNYKPIQSKYVGKVKARNIHQELYMDMLQDEKTLVKAVTGAYGTGKDYLALSNFLDLVDRRIYDKIIWVRNNVEAKGTQKIGYLPGTLTEKLSVFAEIVSDFVGDKVGFEMLMQQNKLELVHTGFLRGRDLRNSIVYCTEAQNMTKELIQLIISRVSENSIIFFNGDIKQTDDVIFRSNNGLHHAIESFKGHELFGYVTLQKTERGPVAEMARLLE